MKLEITAEKELITVIVPIYNVKDYLNLCIESICSQTYNKLQIILVDDGSIDGSAKICDTYKAKDTRISVIHKNNEGVVSARKAGLAYAKGEYTTFVDGDDWIDKNCIDYLIEENKIYKADIIAYTCVEEHNNFQRNLTNHVKDGYYDFAALNKIRDSLFIQDDFFRWTVLPHLCDKVIKTSLLKECHQNLSSNMSFGEDAACTFPCLMRASSLLVINKPMYHYVQRKGSVVKENRELPKENFRDIFSVLYDSFKGSELLNKKLKEYIFFLLLLKKYTSITSDMALFPLPQITAGSRIFVYGAGAFGKVLVQHIRNDYRLELAGWTDRDYKNPDMADLELNEIDNVFVSDYDYVIIAILNEKTAIEIKNSFIDNGILPEKIVYVQRDVLDNSQLPEWVMAGGNSV